LCPLRTALLFRCSAHHRAARSFPTRRSSDLSRKGRELRASARAAVAFYWNRLGKQVRIEGRVEEVSRPRGPVRVGLGRRDLLDRSEEHTSELQSRSDLVCRLLLEKKKQTKHN